MLLERYLSRIRGVFNWYWNCNEVVFEWYSSGIEDVLQRSSREGPAGLKPKDQLVRDQRTSMSLTQGSASP